MISKIKQNVGEYLYKVANLTTIAGGLLTGHGLGYAFTRGDAQSWIELCAGLLMATGSIVYRARNSNKYDPEIRRIKSKIAETENQISGLEKEITASEERVNTIQSEIRNNELLIDACMRRN